MYSLGIDLGGTNIVASVVDDQFNIISTAKTKTNAPRPANAIFDDVEKVCREAVREARLTMSDLVAVGMGSPGTCNADGVIEFANNLAFNNVPAREMLRERLGVDNVFVENDANCAALGEAFAGWRNTVLKLVFSIVCRRSRFNYRCRLHTEQGTEKFRCQIRHRADRNSAKQKLPECFRFPDQNPACGGRNQHQ